MRPATNVTANSIGLHNPTEPPNANHQRIDDIMKPKPSQNLLTNPSKTNSLHDVISHLDNSIAFRPARQKHARPSRKADFNMRGIFPARGRERFTWLNRLRIIYFTILIGMFGCIVLQCLRARAKIEKAREEGLVGGRWLSVMEVGY